MSRIGIIREVRSPLSFFTLALLIVESLIASLAFQAGADVHVLGLIGMGMFVLVVFAVLFLAFKAPEALLSRSAKELSETLPKYARLVTTLTRANILRAQDANELISSAAEASEDVVAEAPEPPEHVTRGLG